MATLLSHTKHLAWREIRKTRKIAEACSCVTSSSRSVADQTQDVHRVTMIPGDGNGPALMYAVREVFAAAAVPVDFDVHWVSETKNRCTDQIVADVIRSVRRNRVAIKGKLATPTWYNIGDLDSVDMRIRRALDLFAKVSRVRSLPGVNARFRYVDLVLIKEQTEGEYSALEYEAAPGTVASLKIATKRKAQHIAKFAFDYAARHRRRRVTAVHKAHAKALSDGMFVEACKQMSRLYPKIDFDEIAVDRGCLQLAADPSQFDVLLTPNLYGNMLHHLCAGMVGGAGVVPRETYSADCAVFEASAFHPLSDSVQGAVANPTAMLLCAANMLHHLNLKSHAKLVEDAVRKVLRDGRVRTADLGGYSTPSEFTTAVIHCLGRFDNLV